MIEIYIYDEFIVIIFLLLPQKLFFIILSDISLLIEICMISLMINKTKLKIVNSDKKKIHLKWHNTYF